MRSTVSSFQAQEKSMRWPQMVGILLETKVRGNLLLVAAGAKHCCSWLLFFSFHSFSISIREQVIKRSASEWNQQIAQPTWGDHAIHRFSDEINFCNLAISVILFGDVLCVVSLLSCDASAMSSFQIECSLNGNLMGNYYLCDIAVRLGLKSVATLQLLWMSTNHAG